MRTAVLVLCALAIVLAANSTCVAQTTTAKVSGIVSDPTGAVLTGAQVTIKNMETGVQRTVLTDAQGQYTAPLLEPGNYEITATAAGFETLVQRGIGLAVGQTAAINLKMTVGAVTSRVEVTAEAPLVETSSGAVAGVVDEKRILELPLNGRDFSQLALVQPGVLSIRSSNQSALFGFGTRISMGGSRVDQTAWLIDGTNIKGQNYAGTPGSAAGVMLGVDAIREFQVLTSSYSAEFGQTSGGVINMVTKSGTNELHGTAYEFLRNSALDARNFFDQQKAPFKRNQFGFSVGGPIKKDKLFFFGNYEALIQRLGLTGLAVLPDANAHAGLVAGPGGTFTQVQVAPEIRPYLDQMPLPNGALLGGNLGQLFFPTKDATREDYVATRVDYHMSDSQSFFARFTLDQATDSRPDKSPVDNDNLITRNRYGVVQYQIIFSPQLLSSTRLSYNRTLFDSAVSLNTAYPSNLFLNGSSYPPSIFLPGATEFGPDFSISFGEVQNLYEFSQSFVYTRSRHSFKFGFNYQHIGSNDDFGTQSNGYFSWGSISNFLTDQPMNQYQSAVPGSSNQRSFKQAVYGAYFQDDWRVTSKLTVNLGVRYEPYTVPSEKYGRISTVKDWVHDTSFAVGVPFFQNPSKKDFSPRVGFAWDVKGDGKTAIRGGFGIFFPDLLGAEFRQQAGKNPPFAAFFSGATTANLATIIPTIAQLAPTLLSPQLSPNSFMQILQYNLNQPYEMKANLTIQRELPGKVSLTMGYLGDRGIHLIQQTEGNTAPPILVNGRPFVVAGTPRLNQQAGQGGFNISDAQSFYNALQIEVKKRFSRGLQFQVSYTFSKNVDDATTHLTGGDFTGQTLQPDIYYTKSDRGLSALDQRNNLTINGTYELPSPLKTGFSSHVLGGWQLSSIVSVSSGQPFSALLSGRNAPDLEESSSRQRPDLVAGRSFSSLILGSPNQYFDPSAFYLPPAGFYGNEGRDIIIGPGFASLDVSISKSTPLAFREGAKLEFRSDFFNLLNRANFAVPSLIQVFNTTTRQPITSAGTITSTVGSSRQLQFSLKVIF